MYYYRIPAMLFCFVMGSTLKGGHLVVALNEELFSVVSYI